MSIIFLTEPPKGGENRSEFIFFPFCKRLQRSEMTTGKRINEQKTEIVADQNPFETGLKKEGLRENNTNCIIYYSNNMKERTHT